MAGLIITAIAGWHELAKDRRMLEEVSTMCSEDDEFYPTGGPGHAPGVAGAFEFHCARGPRSTGEHGFDVNVGALDLGLGGLRPENLLPPVNAPPPAPPPAGPPISDTLNTNAYLSAHASAATNRVPDMQSPSGQAILVFQSDGNLVLYDRDAGALWASGTNGRGGNKAIVQDDGNFVIYDAQNRPLWATGTSGRGAGAYLKVQDDGNLVLYAAGGAPLWASQTSGRLKPRTFITAPLVISHGETLLAYNAPAEASKWFAYYQAITQHLQAGEPIAQAQALVPSPLPPPTPSSLRAAAFAARGM